MYDIFSDIWKYPESTFSPMPTWARLGDFASEGSADDISAELSEMHKRGIDGVVASPATADSFLTPAYSDNITAACAAAKKRHMTLILSDMGAADRLVIAEDKRLSARRLYVLPARTEIPSDEELLFRVSVKTDEKGKLIETALSPDEGFVEYDLVLGYSYESTRADCLNPQTAYDIIEKSLDVHYEMLGEYFGEVVTGILVDPVQFAEGEVPWSYGFVEDFFEAGGDMHMLMSLFFEPREKKFRREAEFAMRRAVSARLGSAYFAPIAKWCEEHRVAMLYAPADAKDSPSYRYATAPGAAIVSGKIAPGAELSSPESVGVKLAADYARHHGLKRSFARITNTASLTPNDVMREVNFAFSRGADMIITDPITLHESEDDIDPSVVRADYKKFNAYMKRMAWLNSTGTHNPVAAVLCTADYVPYTPVKPIIEAGYSFSYLTLDDLMEKCRVHEGKFLIDRYAYDVLLIDSRLRLDAESVTKIGRFVTEGGKMYRGGDFISFLNKNVRRMSYFRGESAENLRFTHITKGGVDFFSMINEGDSWIEGELVTKSPCAAADFDALTGAITAMSCSVDDEGLAYRVRVAPHGVKVIAMNKNALTKIEDERTYKLREITSISEGRTSFDYKAGVYSRAVLSFTDIDGAQDVAVNGKPVCRMMFKPYEVDITDYLVDCVNTVEISGEYVGGCVKLYE
jgi:hypothetical protein